MSEPEYVTKADLETALAEHRSALDDLRKATTTAAEGSARADVEDAEDDLETIAGKLGVPVEQMEKLLEDQEYGRMRRHFERYEADRAAELAAAAEAEKAKKPKPNPKPKPEKDDSAAADEPPPADDDDEDTPPAGSEHWSDRSIGSLLG